MKAFEISMSALNVEWQRLQVIATNLANANTVSDRDGAPVTAKRLISGPAASFTDFLGGAQRSADGVEVYSIDPMQAGSRLVHEPDHPKADADGFVRYPKINHAEEMALMLRTSRIYEANLTSISVAQQMYNRALDIGRSA